ncbi:FHF complex subunit HOOK interacting protein 2A-like [Paramacrobiotus metropolitanus]|uniref:FHF complex subunit HOOK interacting protein 2A-like n=1 Tax=Paramacrobiotus metropolitanus TaxID=2943436 RepID=UPI002445FF14|nr:FHF complex subunit HOOK interacting protein 2A-like [Paramacrobiotus metropolitanus]XP_055334544.1 FHF complex subunit HOOK interacting protein 2A-like [Paramacrobiotus metropolitanus]XP_055334545.1 FHF complex subunit HOOK interacting protein 2A-like [Paramacrobiotus metropolitanus]
MFKFISGIAQTASEYLAPNLKPEEELFLQWHNLVKELKSRNGSLVSVEETDVPLKLQWVFNLLQQELPLYPANNATSSSTSNGVSAAAPPGGIGPCFEVALRYKIFDWLVALAKSDKPAGIKSYVLFFLTNLLKSPNIITLLPKSFIYKPLSRLVQCCGNSHCSPWDREELQFLLGVVDVLQRDPCLANLFLRGFSQEPVEKADADLSAIVDLHNPFLSELHSNDSPSAKINNSDSESFVFPLLDSLLRLAVNPDVDVSAQARLAVVCVLRIREPVVCRAIASSGTLHALTKHLLKLYAAVPYSADVIDTICVQNASEDTERLLRPFLLWITFLDQIFAVMEGQLEEKLGATLQQNLLRSCGFSDDWLSSSGERNQKALGIFMRMYKATDTLALLNVWASVFLQPKLFDKFMQLTGNQELALFVYDLLDTMLQKPVFILVDELLLKYLGTRLYIRKDQRMHESKKDMELTEATDRAAMFRDLFPTAAKSCTVLEEEKDAENYVRESHYSMVALAQRCHDLHWPLFGPLKPCNILLAEESSFFDGNGFNEGPLLKNLFYRLSCLFDQPYAISLRVTGIISKICLLPHPVLREYLLDPTVPLSASCPSLYRCLINLVQKMESYARQYPYFRDDVLKMRQEIKNGQWAEASTNPDNTVASAVVMLEEFCKEVAARAFVRFSNSM